MEVLLPLALGEIGLTYDYFMSLTPLTWSYILKGYNNKRKALMAWQAWLVSNLMNATGNLKEPMTVEKLMDPLKENETNVSEASSGSVSLEDASKWVA